MRDNKFYWIRSLLLAVSVFLILPGTTLAEEIFGGLTFLGDRQDICIEIAGECIEENILFELSTCDVDNEEKEKFKEKMPFTIRVPKGTHELVIIKNGEKFFMDKITIKPEKVLEYQLP